MSNSEQKSTAHDSRGRNASTERAEFGQVLMAFVAGAVGTSSTGRHVGQARAYMICKKSRCHQSATHVAFMTARGKGQEIMLVPASKSMTCQDPTRDHQPLGCGVGQARQRHSGPTNFSRLRLLDKYRFQQDREGCHMLSHHTSLSHQDKFKEARDALEDACGSVFGKGHGMVLLTFLARRIVTHNAGRQCEILLPEWPLAQAYSHGNRPPAHWPYARTEEAGSRCIAAVCLTGWRILDSACLCCWLSPLFSSPRRLTTGFILLILVGLSASALHSDGRSSERSRSFASRADCPSSSWSFHLRFHLAVLCAD